MSALAIMRQMTFSKIDEAELPPLQAARCKIRLDFREDRTALFSQRLILHSASLVVGLRSQAVEPWVRRHALPPR